MSDATEAIEDIQEALEEYGSAITLKQITAGVFDPITGSTANTSGNTTLKTLIRNYSSFELTNSEVHVDDLKFMIYTTILLNYDDILVYDGKEYKILNIDKKILQDVNLFYTVQGRA